ncbi:MAG: hypothetical protein ACJ76A_08220 [Actinomycetota bacterium]
MGRRAGLIRDRSADPDLTWLIDVLWGSEDGSVADRPMPGGTAYVVVPGPHRPRAILPARADAARAALIAGAGTRSRAAQRGRALAAQAARFGLLRPSLFVRGDDPLRASIREALGADVDFACAVRAPGPFRKPVLQVVADGELVAYAKVAWNAVTAANVAAEHRALLALEANAASSLGAPAPITVVEHRGFPVLLTRPMPRELRRFDAGRDELDPAITRLIGELGAPSAGGDPIAARLRSRLRAASGGSLASVASTVERLLDAIGSRAAAIPVGAWHGDWSPWNLGWVGSRLWAWDWEYCRTDVPIGLDLPHFAFQRSFIGERQPLARSFSQARATTAEALSRLGYAPADRATIHAVHVAEIAIRYLEADAIGVAPNPRFVEGADEAIAAASVEL